MTWTNIAPGQARGGRYALAILCLVNIVNYMDRSILSVLIEPIRSDLRLSDTQIGLMTGVAFALFYAAGGLVLAHIADTRSRPALIALSIAIWSTMTALGGAAQNFGQMLAARIGVGVGEAGVIPAANALLADKYSVEKRALALALFTAASMIGIMAGAILGGILASHHGWRWAFVITGLAGLPLSVLVWFTLEDPPRSAVGVSTQSQGPGFFNGLHQILNDRTLVLLVFAYAFLVFMLFGVVTWFPAYLGRAFNLDVQQVGVQFGAAIGVGTAAGSLIGGLAGNGLVKRDVAWMTRLPLISMVSLWPLYQLAIFAPTSTSALTLIALTAAAGGVGLGPLLAAMQFKLSPSLRAKGAALNGFVGSLIGLGGAPVLVGILSDWLAGTTGPARSLQLSLSLTVTVGLVGVAILAIGHHRLCRELRSGMLAHGRAT